MNDVTVKQLQLLVAESISFKHTYIDGGIVSMPTVNCFGMSKIDSLDQLLIAGGAMKHSVLCEINFKSKVNSSKPNFKIAFITKMHSKIFRKASKQQSEWRAMRTNGNTVELMSIATVMSEYDFDVFDFMTSDFMAETTENFINSINSGLGAANRLVTTLNDINDKRTAQNCIATIKAAIPLMLSTDINDRDYSYPV